MKPAKKLIKESKHFCVLPWIHFHGWPDGKVLPCCVADSQMPVSSTTEGDTILDMMNSERYKEIRVAMMNDEYVPECKRCYEIEELGTWTMRQSHNRRRGMDCIDIIEDTNEDGSLDEFQLKYMDTRFSNLCNYKCRSCGPQCSNLWGEEHKKEYGDNYLIDVFQIEDPLITNNAGGTFMDKLRPHLGQVEECYFAGGEILVTPEHYECLDYWVENGLQNQVELNYTTNMSKLTYKDKNGTRNIFDYWKQFPNIQVWASIDDIGERAELIRTGTKWDRVINNLLKIKEEMPHVVIGFTPTISLWNIWNYDEMFDELMKYDLISQNEWHAPRLNLLTFPAHANIKNLPVHMAQELKEKYIPYYENEEYNVHVRNTFKLLIHALDNVDPNWENVIQFKEYNDMVDKRRDESLVKTVPQIEELYTWALHMKSL